MEFMIRQMVAGDIPEVLRIASLAYCPALPESAECFLAKLDAFPKGCLSCVVAGTVVGYGFSHPWDGDPPPLDARIVLPEKPSHYYFHDFSLRPAAQRKGFGNALVAVATGVALARRFGEIRLVSVNGSLGFWKGMGFSVHGEAEYGPAIGYHMRKEIWNLLPSGP